jgi:hypothetical protein
MRRAVVLMAACFAIVSSVTIAESFVSPIIELQSEALTPALVIDESRRPVYQIRLVVDADGKHGTLILDPNVPVFDEFGGLGLLRASMISPCLGAETTGRKGRNNAGRNALHPVNPRSMT